jgi:hypothetical protein
MENTAKNFALQLGSLISLYVSIGALIALLFGIITLLYPDSAQYAWEGESARITIRTTIAILVVFFPTYITLTRIVNKIRRTESGTYLTLTKWLIYLSLLIGGGVLLGDLVTVLNSFSSSSAVRSCTTCSTSVGTGRRTRHTRYATQLEWRPSSSSLSSTGSRR